jgi:hypothetical protein
MTVGADDEVIRQSRNYHRYQPGKSQLVILTYAFGAQNDEVTKRVGYFDDRNGVFVQQDSNGLSIVLRSSITGSPVDTVINQADWNLDVLDGSGDSAITIDPTKSQILFIDLQWLGVGRVRVGFNIHGIVIYAHEFLNANRFDSTYITTANLPVRYSIRATNALAGTDTMRQICSQVTSEGGFAVERSSTFGGGNTAFRSVTTRLPVYAIRPRLTFQGITTRVQVLEELFMVMTVDAPVYYELLFGPTITGGSWSNVNTTHSVMEQNVGATSVSGGLVVEAGYAFGASGGPPGASSASTERGLLRPRLPLALDIDGAHPTSPFTDVLAIACTSLGAATDTVASISWRELR